MIRSGAVFFVADRPSKSSSREANTLELNPMSAQHRSSKRHCQGNTLRLEPWVQLQKQRWTAMSPQCVCHATPSAEERALHEASGHVPYRSWCQWCMAARAADNPHLRVQQPETDEAAPRIKFDFADLGREEDQALPIPSLNAVDVGSERLSATLSHESIQ